MHEKLLMEENQLIVEDIEASPRSEAPKVVGLKAPLQLQLETWGKANEAEKFTIFRTPHGISQNKNYLFEPSVISIGPFHRGQKHLRAMEEQKRRYLRDFLSRKDHISLGLCISKMKSLEMRTRRCYTETFDELDSDTFVEMMLLDGCFLLEYFSKYFERNMSSISEVGWNRQFIIRDLLLQENQIPFFIVDKLQQLIGINQEHRMRFIKRLALFLLPKNYILPAPPAETLYPPDKIPDPSDEIHHLVHLCYHYLVPNTDKPLVLSSKSFDLTTKFQTSCIEFSLSVLPNSTRIIPSMVIPSATELKQKGVKFTPKSNPKHILDISFENGVLKIPRLKITDDTKPLFTNLLAFEQSKFRKMGGPFTSFLVFLDNLVNTQNDVTILQESRIIENWLGSEEALSHFFNHVTEGGGLVEDHYLAELNKEVNRYIGSRWNRHRAKLIREYFSSPWAAISLFAAFILLVLTCIQTFYAVYAYKFPPSS